jgi:uncharacterized protein
MIRSTHPLSVFDHLFALFLVVGFPLLAKFYGYPRLLDALDRGEPDARTGAYLFTIALQWTLVAILAIAWWRLSRSATALGLAWPRGWRQILAYGIPALAIALAGLQYAAVMTQPLAIEQARTQMGDMIRMVPHTRAELNTFMVLSVTAGICEELLYRSFLVGYAARFMPPWIAAVVTGLVFGFGHIYQGIDGAIQTGVVGIIFGVLYVVIGSVWPLMAAHAIVDIGGGWVGHAVAVSSAP